MKKGLLLFVMLLIATFGFSQTTTLPVNFEGGAASVTFTDFDGGTTTILSNPSATGINTSSYVAQTIKSGGQAWGGTYLTLASGLDFSTNDAFKMKVYTPAVGTTVLFKIEAEDGSAVERSLSSTVANQWEELTYNFGTQTSNTYTKIVIIFDLATTGDGTANSTYYFDDIQFTQTGVTQNQIDLPVTFEDANTDYTVIDFGGNTTSLVADPANSSNTVAKTVKNSGSETWAGTTMSTDDGFASAIPFTSDNKKMSIKIYSPAPGITIRLKVEDKTDGNITCETESLTTVANSWEVIVFDFSNQADGTAALDIANTYDKASIFFDFGNTGDNSSYYWDDVKFGGSSTSDIQHLTKEISVYPNPVEDIFVVQGVNNVQNLNIYSVNGQLVNFTKVSNNSFDVSNLQSGVYTISATDNEGNVITGKLIKK